MNKLFNLRQFIFLLIITMACPASSKTSGLSNNFGKNENDEIRHRVKSMSTIIDVRYTDKVREQIDYLIGNKRLSTTLLGRAVMYFPMMDKIFDEYNIPQELKHLAVIESGLVPYFSSGAGAAGLWQLMPGTAEMFGLKIKSTIDERKDAEKSTHAAAKYLKKLHGLYGDWTMVLAAYNCGDGRLNKAIKSAGSTDYWEVEKFLPQQTQDFLPRFIAASYLMNFYYAHELEPDHLPEEYVYTGSIIVKEKVDLDKIAEEYQVSPEAIRRLNAIYVKGFIPETEDEEFSLVLPESIIYQYAENNNLLDKVGGFSIASIMRQKENAAGAVEDVKKEAIAIADIPPAKPIIPIGIPARAVSIKEDNSIVKVVRLSKGKSLKDIAQEHGTDLASLLDYNKFSEQNLPRLGDPIKIRI
jgi:hypothetical protein